jgi:sulfur carrier protein
MMTIIINGEGREIPDGTSLYDLLARLDLNPEEPGVAAALDGEVVFRRAWRDTPLKPGSRLEIVRAVAGG